MTQAAMRSDGWDILSKLWDPTAWASRMTAHRIYLGCAMLRIGAFLLSIDFQDSSKFAWNHGHVCATSQSLYGGSLIINKQEWKES
jgi:hypothetical protein